MKVIVLGAGQVGSSVACGLAGENNDITVVDTDPVLLAALTARLDVRVVVGHASHPDVLLRAGVEDADLVLAVTNSDETNMIACQIAYSLFHTPTRIARIRSADYHDSPALFSAAAIPIDLLISPEERVTHLIRQLIDRPGALQMLDFAGGRVQMVAVRAHPAGSLVGQQLAALPVRLGKKREARVVAIYRHDRPVVATEETRIESDDEVFVLAKRQHVPAIVQAFQPAGRRNRRLIIAGGGNIGKRLAEQTESACRVKIIEHDAARCRHLAEVLDQALVLHSDAADENLLVAEGIADTDVFCAVTNDDEVNILAAMLARQLGARRVISLINRPSYVDLAQSSGIDVAISPAQVTIGALLTYVRRGDVVAVHSLRRGAAEAIEIIAHGSPETSPVVGRRLADIAFPQGAAIGGIVRGEQLILADAEVVVETDDHLIVFLADKRGIAEVERLFQVAVTFL